jgi:hypothetical protein
MRNGLCDFSPRLQVAPGDHVVISNPHLVDTDGQTATVVRCALSVRVRLASVMERYVGELYR